MPGMADIKLVEKIPEWEQPFRRPGGRRAGPGHRPTTVGRGRTRPLRFAHTQGLMAGGYETSVPGSGVRVSDGRLTKRRRLFHSRG